LLLTAIKSLAVSGPGMSLSLCSVLDCREQLAQAPAELPAVLMLSASWSPSQ
jgi:hypothetical protein